MTGKAVGIVLGGILLYILLKKYAPEYAVLAEVVTVLLLFFLIAPETEAAVQSFGTYFGSIGGNAAAYTGLLIRTCGIALITSFAAGLCRDAGETAAAAAAEFAGKVLIVTSALPLLGELTGMIAEMVNRA